MYSWLANRVTSLVFEKWSRLLFYLHIVEWVLFSKLFQVFLLFFRQAIKKLFILSSFAHVDNVLPFTRVLLVAAVSLWCVTDATYRPGGESH